MAKIFRIFVEKKTGYDIEAQAMLTNLRDNLGIGALQGLRLLNRYDICGISRKEYAQARHAIFSEPPVDEIYNEKFPLAAEEMVFAIEYLPGQYDQRADSAVQCLQLLSAQSRSRKGTGLNAQPLVVFARVVVLRGKLTATAVKKIKHYFINPVDSCEAALDKPASLIGHVAAPAAVPVLKKFIARSAAQLKALGNELGLAMDGADLHHCQNYFQNQEQRDPTLAEIRLLDTYWSDHCRHTTFLTEITGVDIRSGHWNEPLKKAYDLYLATRSRVHGNNLQKEICLMDLALLAMNKLRQEGRLEDLEISGEINACSIVVPVEVDGCSEDWLVMFKNETHNHPTEIEPYGGAATCLGGAIRDPLSGRVYVYQAMRVTGSGDPRTPVRETLAGKLPQRKISIEAAQGFSAYGNQVGMTTGQVTEIYHAGYVAKRLEIGAVIGAAPKRHVIRAVPAPGDVILLVGGRTGRDGIGGATGSSKSHHEGSLATCGAEVQKGNPPCERKLQRLFRNPQVSLLIKRCNDFGAGGVAVAVGELAAGLDIDLDQVPKKYAGLDGSELALSESQERMAVVVASRHVKKLQKLAAAENLEATPIARVGVHNRLKMKWRGRTIVDLDRNFLDSHGARRQTAVTVAAPGQGNDFFRQAHSAATGKLPDLRAAWLAVLGGLNVCSQKGLVERFDSSIGAGTVLAPFGGKYQTTPAETMIAKIPLLQGETHCGTMMAFGFNPDLSSWSPFHGGVYALLEAVSKVAAGGGDYRTMRLSLQEYFAKPGQDPIRWGQPLAALLGVFLAQLQLGIPAIGGKDSMSGSFRDLDVPPTLVAFAVTAVDVRRVLSSEFKRADSQVIYLPLRRDDYEMPDFNQLKNNYALVHDLIKNGKVLAAQAVRGGGLVEALSKMSFGNRIGMVFAKDIEPRELMTPAYGSLLLEISGGEKVNTIFSGTDYRLLGRTAAEPAIMVNGITIAIADMQAAWEKPLEDIFPTRLAGENKLSTAAAAYQRPFFAERNIRQPRQRFAKPRVLITTFPGTNNEYDVARAFTRAGGVPEIFIFRNRHAADIEASLVELDRKLRRCQILMIPGGFSAGDEPDGSGKFIAAVFRNARVSAAVRHLLDKKDGLILGICNGFQALIKLGLLPHGEIRDLTPQSPTLTFNLIGRLISRSVNTKVVSTLSPWFNLCQAGDIHTIPVAHVEGRFVAPEATIELLFSLGQVATQYVDFLGQPATDSFFNPNGSMLAIESISSPDGRILGKMGHSDRISDHVLQNIPGDKEQKIFASGVRYFQ